MIRSGRKERLIEINPEKPRRRCVVGWPMPRFYFNLANDMFVRDEEGMELPDVEAARAQAVKYARDMSAATVAEEGKINLHHRIDVVDEAGQGVLTVEFGDVVRIETSPPAEPSAP